MNKVISITILLLSILLTACAKHITPDCTNNTLSSLSPYNRRLQISAISDQNAGFTVIPNEKLVNNSINNLTYFNLINVTVEINDKTYLLELAIQEDMISAEEIFAYARIDARNGACIETQNTTNGLTHFTYHYPEFDLRIVYDVYETPDGKTHLINDIGLYEVGSNIHTTYTDDETGLPIDRENWGLTFEYVSATSEGVTLKYRQTEGQQIGDIIVEHFTLYNSDYDFIDRLENVNSIAQYQTIPLEKNTVSQFTIEWKDIQGFVPSGEYIIRLHLRDIFDITQVHPLMKDFSDTLYYDVPISIP